MVVHYFPFRPASVGWAGLTIIENYNAAPTCHRIFLAEQRRKIKIKYLESYDSLGTSFIASNFSQYFLVFLHCMERVQQENCVC